MPFIAIDASSADGHDHCVRGWGATAEQASANAGEYPVTQVLEVSQRTTELCEAGAVRCSALGLGWNGSVYFGVPLFSAPPPLEPEQLAAFTQRLRDATVPTIVAARSMLQQVTWRWRGRYESTAQDVTFYSDGDTEMDAIADAVLSHQYIRDAFWVDEGVAGKYHFVRAPRVFGPPPEPES